MEFKKSFQKKNSFVYSSLIFIHELFCLLGLTIVLVLDNFDISLKKNLSL